MMMEKILELPVIRPAPAQAHPYLSIPNPLISEGLEVMKWWGLTYKMNLVWYKIREDGGPDGRGVGLLNGSYGLTGASCTASEKAAMPPENPTLVKPPKRTSAAGCRRAENVTVRTCRWAGNSRRG